MVDKIKISEFVRSLVTSKGFEADFSDEETLITGGLLDSMDVLTIVLFLEESFGLDLDVTDFDPDKFDTIDGIFSMVSD
jgi:acyl carrier protein